jgi:hypothetical protein
MITMKDQTLRVGSTLLNGATVVACTKSGERVENETLANWIAICVRGGDNHDDYVVWRIAATEKGFSAESGDYSNTLTEAIENYERRGGKL